MPGDSNGKEEARAFSFSVTQEEGMGFLDNIYWKVKLFLSEWLAGKEDDINEKVTRFKRWLDGE